jgi:hypothetical protein
MHVKYKYLLLLLLLVATTACTKRNGQDKKRVTEDLSGLKLPASAQFMKYQYNAEGVPAKEAAEIEVKVDESDFRKMLREAEVKDFQKLPFDNADNLNVDFIDPDDIGLFHYRRGDGENDYTITC